MSPIGSPAPSVFGDFRMASPNSVDEPEVAASSSSSDPTVSSSSDAEGGAESNLRSFLRRDGRNGVQSRTRMSEPLPLSYITTQEIRCVLNWMPGWNSAQKECFLRDLVSKAVPWNMFSLLEGMVELRVESGKPPLIFQCQMRLWDQWFRTWSEAERNEFVRQMEEKMPEMAERFYQEVAATAGQF